MILYINGAEHTSGVRARHHFIYAEDDQRFVYMGKQSHPENAALAFPRRLNLILKTSIVIDARPMASNAYILRKLRTQLEKKATDRQFMLIHWAPFDREEFLLEKQYYQVSTSMTPDIPKSLDQKYKKFKREFDDRQVQKHWHNTLWHLHKELEQKGIYHLFVMESSPFTQLSRKHIWGDNFINPYEHETTFMGITKQYLNPDEHGFFQEKGHLKYTKHILPQCIKLLT